MAIVERSQKSVIFRNNTTRVIFVRLEAESIVESYSKQESSRYNANKSGKRVFRQAMNTNLSTNLSTNYSDQSWSGGAEVGAAANVATSAVVAVGAGIGSLFGANASSASSASRGGQGLFDANVKRTNIKSNMENNVDQHDVHKTNSNQQLCDNKQRDYQFKECVIQTNEIQVGYSKIMPSQSKTVKVEICRDTQVECMTIYIPSIRKYVCQSSTVPYEKISVEHDETHNEYFAREDYPKEFEKVLNEWGLSEYKSVMDKEGWSDCKYWKNLTEEVVINDLKFKRGHFVKFKDLLLQEKGIQIVPKDSGNWYFVKKV